MDTVAENYQLKWHSFNTHLHSCVAAAINGDNFADVFLFTLDGHRVPAHRFILSACSQYLHQVLKTHHKTTTTLPVSIIMPPEIGHKTLKTLVQYMYSGEATVSKDILESVLRGGDILRIRGLWRPREEEQTDRKLVKLHQKYEPIKSRSNNKENTAHSSNSQKQSQPDNRTDSNISLSNYKITLQKKDDNQTDAHKSSTKKPETKTGSLDSSEDDAREEHPKDTSNKNFAEATVEKDQMQFLVIKEEPVEWSEVNESEMELIDENEVFHTEMTIKPEIFIESEEQEDEMYSPLTCELCTETFRIPAEWVKHIQTHTDMLPAKRQRRGKPSSDEDNGTFPPLQCDMCQKYYPTPAEWVHHIQNVHTEMEMRQSNKRDAGPKSPKALRQTGSQHKVCSICNKKFPSHASMLIHKRTHTGEKPYMCQYCCKGFNVKSNLLRHLRTLHDKIVNSAEVDSREEDGNSRSDENF